MDRQETSQETYIVRKRMKQDMEEDVGDGAVTESVEDIANVVASEKMELEISHIHEKIERYTQMVSELLESGKTLFRDLSNEFEERMILIHKEQMEKWQEEIKELRLLDASNENVNAVLHNAHYLLRNVPIDS